MKNDDHYLNDSEALTIKIIFFDVGSVLLRRKEDFDLKAAEYLGIDPLIYKERLIEIIESEICRNKYRAISNLAEEHQFQTWINKEILEDFNLKLSDKKIAYLSDIRLNRSWNYQLIEDVLETLDYLKERYRLGIISNAPPSRRHFELKDFDLEKYFDPIILSGEVQSSKPEEEIFKIAINLAKVKASDSALIDNKPENLQAAQNLGLVGASYLIMIRLSNKNFEQSINLLGLKKSFSYSLLSCKNRGLRLRL